MAPLTSTGARILFVRIPRGRVFTSNQFVLPKDQTAVPCKLAMRLALPQRTFSDQDMVPKHSVFWWRYELAAVPLRTIVFVVFPQATVLHIGRNATDETLAVPRESLQFRRISSTQDYRGDQNHSDGDQRMFVSKS